MHTGDIGKRLRDNSELLKARLDYDDKFYAGYHREYIYVLHLKVLTNIMLNICQDYVKDENKIYKMLREHPYTIDIIEHVDRRRLSLLKKIEFWIIVHVFRLAPIYFRLKSYFCW